MIKPGDVVVPMHQDTASESNAGLVYMLSVYGPCVLYIHHSDKMERIGTSCAVYQESELRVLDETSPSWRSVWDKVKLVQGRKGYGRIVPKSVLERILGHLVLDEMENH